MQSPLDYPTSALGRASRNVRILRFDIASERVTGDFVYHFDEVCAFLGEAALPGIPNKIAGIALVRPDVLTIANDNDFGLVDNATFDAAARRSNDTRFQPRCVDV